MEVALVLEHPFAKLAWLGLAALAGAITALSFRPFKHMTRAEIIIAVFVGFSFAAFVGPWAAAVIFGDGPVDLRILGGVFYIMATGSNLLLPPLIRKVGELFGVKAEPKGDA